MTGENKPFRLRQMMEIIKTPAEILKEILPDDGIIKPQLNRIIPPFEAEIKAEIIEHTVILASAMIANNPNLKATLDTEWAKKTAIEQDICNKDYGNWTDDSCSKCEFTVYDVVREGPKYNKSLADWKTVHRHLEAEVETGDLDKEIKDGREVYIYHRYWKKLGPVL